MKFWDSHRIAEGYKGVKWVQMQSGVHLEEWESSDGTSETLVDISLTSQLDPLGHKHPLACQSIEVT